MEKLNQVANVEGLGKVVELYSNFYNQILAFKGRARWITPRDEAYARIKTQGKENIGKGYGTRTSAGFEYAKGQLPLLNLFSRLLDPELAEKAVNANASGSYFHTDSTKEYEESLKIAEQDKNKAPKEGSVIILPSRDSFNITRNENWDVLETALKDQADKYFEINRENPIYVALVDKDTVDNQPGTLLTQMWFWWLGSWSRFLGGSRDLLGDCWARGVLESAEGTPQKTVKPKVRIHTNRQVDKYLRTLDRIAQGKVKISELESEVEKVAEFLRELKR